MRAIHPITYSELLPVKRTVKNHKILQPVTIMLLVVLLRRSAPGSPRCDSGHYSGRSKQLQCEADRLADPVSSDESERRAFTPPILAPAPKGAPYTG